MNKVIKEFGKLASVKLLSWSLRVMPSCDFKNKLAQLVSSDMLTGMD